MSHATIDSELALRSIANIAGLNPNRTATRTEKANSHAAPPLNGPTDRITTIPVAKHISNVIDALISYLKCLKK
jgi:hypothetical protein